MAGNWKMYKTPAETVQFFEKFRPLVEKSSHCEIVICPPFTNLAAAVDAVKGSAVKVGSQNIGWVRKARSGRDLRHAECVGVSRATVGTERRQYWRDRRHRAEADPGGAEFADPIVRGEMKAEARAARRKTLRGQFQNGIAGLTPDQFAKIIIAYEPAWRSGRLTATPGSRPTHTAIGQVREVRRKRLPRPFYGGSVAGQHQDADGAAGNEARWWRRQLGRRSRSPRS
jgi:triosephosphate isomerase